MIRGNLPSEGNLSEEIKNYWYIAKGPFLLNFEFLLGDIHKTRGLMRWGGGVSQVGIIENVLILYIRESASAPPTQPGIRVR